MFSQKVAFRVRHGFRGRITETNYNYKPPPHACSQIKMCVCGGGEFRMSTVTFSLCELLSSTSTVHTVSWAKMAGRDAWEEYLAIYRMQMVASLVPRLSPQKQGRREPGNIRGESCRLPPPCSGGTNQIAERNHVYT